MRMKNPDTRLLYASIIVFLTGCLVFSSPTVNAEANAIYVDDCQHWIQIAAATVALRTAGDEKLDQVLGYIDQYLINSQISSDRKKQLLDRIRQVWVEGLMFGHDLEHQLMDKCDVK